jgi:hypothetical protein
MSPYVFTGARRAIVTMINVAGCAMVGVVAAGLIVLLA